MAPGGVTSELFKLETRVQRHVDRLREPGLPRGGDGNRLIPSGPEAAVARLTDRRPGELHDALQQVTGVRQITDDTSR